MGDAGLGQVSGARGDGTHGCRLSPDLPSYSPIILLSPSALTSILDIDSHAIVRGDGELDLTICFLFFKH